MSTAPLAYGDRETVLGALRDHWGWLLALGIVFAVLGAVGIALAVLYTVVSVLLFGVLLEIGAVLQLVQAYQARRRKGRIPHVLIVAVDLVVNGWMCIFIALAARRAGTQVRAG